MSNKVLDLLKEMDLPPDKAVWTTFAALADYVRHDNILRYYVEALAENGYRIELQ